MHTIQATNIGGKAIAGAKWKVETLAGLAIGHVLHVNLPFKDKALAATIGTLKRGATVEREEEGRTSVTLGMLVERFTHLLEVGEDGSTSMESMVWVKPLDRTVEELLLYITERESCNSRFVALVKSKSKSKEEKAPPRRRTQDEEHSRALKGE